MEVCEELDLRDVMFVGHSVSAMVGVLAARAAPERFAALVMVAPSPCYIDDERLPGRVQRGGHRRAAGVAGVELSGLVGGDGPGHHGQPGAAGAGRGADQQLLRHRSGHGPGLRPHHVPVRQPRRPGDGDGADAGAGVRAGRHRPPRGRRLRPRRDPRQPPGHPGRDRALPAAERTAGHRGGDHSTSWSRCGDVPHRPAAATRRARGASAMHGRGVHRAAGGQRGGAVRATRRAGTCPR